MFHASGEAILGTQRYFSKPYSQRSLDLGFQKNLAASEPNEETGRNLRSQIQENDEKGQKEEGRIVPKNVRFAIRILSRTQF